MVHIAVFCKNHSIVVISEKNNILTDNSIHVVTTIRSRIPLMMDFALPRLDNQ